MSSRPRIKICGITSPADARLSVDAGADYLGLNFFAGSPRCVALDRALEIRAEVGPDVRLVGVFVKHSAAEVTDVAQALDLDLLQFHGDEDAEFVSGFGARAIKVWRRLEGLGRADFDAFPDVWGFLCDAFDPRLYGGSGRSWKYEEVLALPTAKPVFVAGGLNPDNIAAAVSRVPVYGFDLCSGVESRPGRKDPRLLRRLFEEISHVQEAAS